MAKAMYPGSFDPVTLGHLNVIKRASSRFDELIVAVLNNNKKNPLFSIEERVNMLKEVTKDIPNIKIMSFEGLLVNFAQQNGVDTIIRGLRAITDFEYELQMAQVNKAIAPEIETMFLTTDVEYSYLSSSAVRELAAFGGNIEGFVPDCLVDRIYEKYE